MNEIYKGADAVASIEAQELIREQISNAMDELLDKIPLSKGDIFVVGCSSSEVMGSMIGHGSSYDTARILYEVVSVKLSEKGAYLAAQCCEHLNRALVIEADCAEKYGYDRVSVIPQPKAGGSFATLAFQNMKSPVVVEHIKAHAGIDIGDTLIGMHLRDVAVPIRLSVKTIGEANLVCAYTRPKFIGGCRAIYQ